MKIDPYKHKERYLKWKEVTQTGIPDISRFNYDLIKNYLNDMETGMNIASLSAKGARSFIRLNTLKEKMIFFAKKFKELYGLNKITEISEEQLISFFANMKNGAVKKADGGIYRSVDTFAKAFKAFWHWHQKVNRKKGVMLNDITTDLDTRQEKPDWVYLTEKEVKLLCDKAKYEYKVLMMFLFDTGIRAPTELMNIKVSDLFNDCKELNIRDEISKTFGRRIKLMISSQMIKDYISEKKLGQDDFLFTTSPQMVNKYIKRLAKNILGDKESPAGQKYSQLTMYDFRHCSCCYWLPKYKSESALKYRFGWKKSEKIHYYSELLGMSDTISDDDMFTEVTKTELEKRMSKTEKERDILKERVINLEMQMMKISELVDRIHKNAKEQELLAQFP
jgi:integrase